jgi:hypothetical protein
MPSHKLGIKILKKGVIGTFNEILIKSLYIFEEQFFLIFLFCRVATLSFIVSDEAVISSHFMTDVRLPLLSFSSQKTLFLLEREKKQKVTWKGKLLPKSLPAAGCG